MAQTWSGLCQSFGKERRLFAQLTGSALIFIQFMERKAQIVEALLAKPSKKPDFSMKFESSILKKAQAFIPEFITTTDRLLSDPSLLKESQMDIKVVDQGEKQLNQDEFNKLQIDQDFEQETIQMDIGVGVYDVIEGDYKQPSTLPQSTMPIVRIEKHNKGAMEEDKDDSSSSGSEGLFYEFGSDSEESHPISDENQSSTTKGTTNPMIQDITETSSLAPVLGKRKRKNKK